MSHTQPLYTLGNWNVRPGHETEFIAAWKAFAIWTARRYSEAGTGYLLQDEQYPQTFVSYGQWDNDEAITRWRATPEFQQFAVKVRSLCESFVPHTMKLVASSTQ